MKKLLYDLLIVLLAGILCFCGWQLYKIYRSYHKGTTTYEKIRDEAVTVNDTDDIENTSDELPTKVPITVDWDKLKAINPHVVGYIYCEGTKINYPVLQGDDNDQYLHHLTDGTYNYSGSIFMDCDADPDLSDKRTLIYGHHMKNGSMFAALHQYRDQRFYKAHKYMWYLTPDTSYRLDLIAGYVAKPTDSIYQKDFENQKELEEFLSESRMKSDFKSKTPHLKDLPEHVIILSTCAYEYKDARYIVICDPVKI